MSDRNSIKWLSQYSLTHDSIDLVALIEWQDGKRDVMQPVEQMMKRQNYGDPISPTMRLNAHSARSLLQALWDTGLRPAENTDRSGEVAALKQHIGFAEHVAKALLSPPEFNKTVPKV